MPAFDMKVVMWPVKPATAAELLFALPLSGTFVVMPTAETPGSR